MFIRKKTMRLIDSELRELEDHLDGISTRIRKLREANTKLGEALEEAHQDIDTLLVGAMPFTYSPGDPNDPWSAPRREEFLDQVRQIEARARKRYVEQEREMWA